MWEDCERFGCYGSRNEGVYSPNVNSGFFTAALDEGNLKGTFCGHDHGTFANRFCCWSLTHGEQ